MDTSKDISKQIEYKIVDVLTNGNYINGITAVEISEKLSPLLVGVFKEYIEEKKVSYPIPLSHAPGIYLEGATIEDYKKALLEGLEKEEQHE